MLTDPERLPDPEAAAARLPRGAGIVHRTFGAHDAEARTLRLAAAARRRGLVLLVGLDPRLAKRCGAAGVHLPERAARRAQRLKRRGFIVTAAAHGSWGLAQARKAGCDAALLSCVFPSRSPSAGEPMGAVRFAALVRRAGLPVYALGGVSARTAPRLLGSGAAGLAAVGAFTG